MQLLNKEIISQIPELYSTEDIPMEDKKFICKFFDPCGSFTWYVAEGSYQEGDYMMFGLVDGFEKEWGYFGLNELKSLVGPLGLGIERDIYFGDQGPEPAEKYA